MRDYRDAKVMAHTLRDALSAKHCKITVGESLELVAHLFGVTDWNTLAAVIKTSATSNNSDPEPAPISANGGPGKVRFARTTEATLRRTLALAAHRNQEEATVLHLLFALTDDPDAAALMKGCNAAPAAFREALESSGEIGRPPPDDHGVRQEFGDPTPAPAFQRVVQRAILDLQASGGGDLTGAHLLAAIFSERDAVAGRILSERGVTESAVLRIVTGRAG